MATLLPLSALWLAGADQYALEALRRLANLSLPDVVFWPLREIASGPDGMWILRTWWTIVGTDEHPLVRMHPTMLGYVLRGLPMTLALVIATSGLRPRRLLAAIALYALLALLACMAVIAAHFAVVLNHQVSLTDGALRPPPYRVSATPLSDAEFFLTCYAYYFSRLILPLFGTLAIWVALSRKELVWLLAPRNRRQQQQRA